MDEEAHDAAVLRILQARDGKETVAVLQDGSRKIVFDIAWGYDMGDVSAHITTNISPPQPDHPVIDFFFTSDVVALESPQQPGVNLLAEDAGGDGA